MAFVAADWSIDRQTKDIRYIGNGHTGVVPSYATVIEFHRALQDFADDAGYSNNDELDITDPTPSERSTDNIVTLINGWNIDDTAAEHIYDGSVIQGSGGSEVIYDGIKILAPIGTAVQFLQNGSILPTGTHTGSSNAATLTDSTKAWTTNQWANFRIRNLTDGSSAVIASNTATTITATLTGGTENDWDSGDKYIIVSVNDWWNYSEGGTHTGSANAATLTDSTKSWTTNQWVGYRIRNTTDGSFTTITANTATTVTGVLQGGTDNDWDASDVYVIVDGLNGDSTNGVSHNFMLKVRTAGLNIDGRRLVATTREWGRTYLEFKVNGTTRGINVVALAAATDLNNTTSSTTVAGYTAITNTTAGYNGIDVNNDTTDEYYYSEWNKDTYTINQFYERMKYISRDGSFTAFYGLSGEVFRGITHEITIDGGSGTWSAVEQVSWTGGVTGTGQMFAINNTTATSATKMWIQILTGVAPTNNDTITGATSGATNAVNVTVTERTISTPFCGVSTGSAIIGAYGFGIESTDLSQNDKVFDLTNTQYQAPNYVTFTVGGIASGDRVLVGPAGYRFAYDTEASGPFVVGETLTFTSPAGTAVLAELVDSGTTGYMVIGPMVTGTVPTDNSTITGGTSSATAAVNGSVSNAINTRQFTLNGALSGGSVTSVVVNGAIPADTPSSATGVGGLRILRADGQYTLHAYTAWSGSTFTIPSHNFSTNNAANGANTFLSYIDKATATTSEAFTGVYAVDRSLFIRVRNGTGGSPIKTFETTGTLGNAGGSTTAIRTSDS
jgi:hypothetical protein